eukprot:7421877-Lingulodinium_polyedra.AAC.1
MAKTGDAMARAQHALTHDTRTVRTWCERGGSPPPRENCVFLRFAGVMHGNVCCTFIVARFSPSDH